MSKPDARPKVCTTLMKTSNDSQPPSSRRLYVRKGIPHRWANSAWVRPSRERSNRMRFLKRATTSLEESVLAFSKPGSGMIKVPKLALKMWITSTIYLAWVTLQWLQLVFRRANRGGLGAYYQTCEEY